MHYAAFAVRAGYYSGLCASPGQLTLSQDMMPARCTRQIRTINQKVSRINPRQESREQHMVAALLPLGSVVPNNCEPILAARASHI